MDEKSSTLGRIQKGVEDRLSELASSGELRGLPGEGAPLADEGGPDETWAARRVMKNANATPAWTDIRRDIDTRVSRLRRRLAAHHEWLRDRTRLLAELPAERIVDTAHATTARDARVRAEVERELSEVNALIRRYDLIVTPALQLPLVTLGRLEEPSG